MTLAPTLDGRGSVTLQLAKFDKTLFTYRETNAMGAQTRVCSKSLFSILALLSGEELRNCIYRFDHFKHSYFTQASHGPPTYLRLIGYFGRQKGGLNVPATVMFLTVSDNKGGSQFDWR
jgi:hypothetical protein